MTQAPNVMNVDCQPLTLERWDAFERLFGERGACGGCWCMLWRLPRKQFEAQKGEDNRGAMKDLVASGDVPGLVGYLGREPVGWCAVAPRDQYPALGRSRILKPVDDQPCWSIACLFVQRAYRNQGLSVQLLRGAIDYVHARGGSLLEGYPVEPRSDTSLPPAFAWTGIATAFEAAGFTEVARRSETRPIMRVNVASALRERGRPW